jgi:hypothetical protein
VAELSVLQPSIINKQQMAAMLKILFILLIIIGF